MNGSINLCPATAVYLKVPSQRGEKGPPRVEFLFSGAQSK